LPLPAPAPMKVSIIKLSAITYKPKGKFQFKEPTEEDMKRLALSNSNFLKKRKKQNIIAIIISFVIALVILNWIFMEWPWRDMVIGFMKGYGR